MRWNLSLKVAMITDLLCALELNRIDHLISLVTEFDHEWSIGLI